MARKPRIEFTGALYHVIARGNNKQRIFYDEKDYLHFLKRLRLYKERFKFVLYAYSLMPNHIHLLIESGESPLSKVMQALLFTYTQFFNRRRKKIGHLFQGRYKAILCQRESYLMELIRYIVLNPLRARLTNRLADWRWSSYFDILQLKDKHVVSVNETLGLFGKKSKSAANLFQKFVNDGLSKEHKEEFYRLKDQRILGDDDFAEEIIKCGDAVCDFERYDISVDDVVKLVLEHTGIREGEIKSQGKNRNGTFGRGLVAYVCRRMGNASITEVGRFFGRSQPIMSRIVKNVELKMENDSNFNGMVLDVIKNIKGKYKPCFVRSLKDKKL